MPRRHLAKPEFLAATSRITRRGAAAAPALWTPRVWPGAVLVDGEIVGVWRRAGERLTIGVWKPLTRAAREAVEAEAASMPLPDMRGPIILSWNG
jgi:winged helix DNA-binding protein